MEDTGSWGTRGQAPPRGNAGADEKRPLGESGGASGGPGQDGTWPTTCGCGGGGRKPMSSASGGFRLK